MSGHLRPYRVRKAIAADLAFTHVWRNDPVTRKMARVAAPLSPAQYRAWFRAQNAAPDRLMLLGLQGNTPLGYASFAPFWERGAWTISLTLAPEHRGQGHGRGLLPLFVRKAGIYLNLVCVIAHIRAENAPSHRLFSGAGFVDQGAEDGVHRYRLPVRAADASATMDQSSASPRRSGRAATAPST